MDISNLKIGKNIEYIMSSQELIEALGKEITNYDGKTRQMTDNLKAVFPSDCELQIDIDSGYNKSVFEDQWRRFNIMVPEATIKSYKSSKSGQIGRFHIVITLPFRVNAEQRIMLLALLGSDLKRELYNLCSLVNGDETPTVFLEKKE